MPPYAYPIKIDRNRQKIVFQENKTFENMLTLADLKFVGNDPFDVTRDAYDYHEITVYRTRLETDQERDIRVAQEESYMKEYNRHQQLADIRNDIQQSKHLTKINKSI